MDEAGLSPVLFDLDVELPLEVLLLVVVCEEGVDVVGPASRQTRGGVLHGSGVALDGLLGSVGTNHVGHLVDWKTSSKPSIRETRVRLCPFPYP